MPDRSIKLLALLAAAVISAIGCAIAKVDVPRARIDHLILAINDLQTGLDRLEDLTGVRAVLGGRHPHLGTQNALIALGPRLYLEILAPHPDMELIDDMAWLRDVDQLEPTGWAASTGDLDQLITVLRDGGYGTTKGSPGSRARPDGATLSWTTMGLTSPAIAAAPFFIEWDASTEHPATTSPDGCTLTGLSITTPEPAPLNRLLELLQLDVTVQDGGSRDPSMTIALQCPNGLIEFEGLAGAVSAGVEAPPREVTATPISWDEAQALPRPAADQRIAYGEGEHRFGELRLPPGRGPFPVVILIHGGCWMAEFDLEYMASAGAALVEQGVAVWTFEYRRIGNPGGGWPGTFEDVARGIDHLRVLANEFPLDLDRVVLAGHSAGGHLALWAAARHSLPATSPLHTPDPLPVHGVVSLAGITDLQRYGEGPRDCNAAVARLIGGRRDEFPQRYIDGNPAALLPLGVPIRLVQGALDPIVPIDQAFGFAEAARARGDDARVVLIEGAGHFDLTAPPTEAWPSVRQAIIDLLFDQRGD